MNFIYLLRDLIFGWLADLYNFVSNLFVTASDNGLNPDFSALITTSIVIVFILGSPFLAASFAEMRGKNRLVHFLGGLVLPWIYPIILFMKMVKNPARDIEEKKEDGAVDDVKAEEGEVPETKLKYEYYDEKEGVHIEKEKATVMDQKYFAKISSDELGNSLGPYMLELLDGRTVEIAKIINPMPEVVILEINDKGKLNTIRFPYVKIKNCIEKKYWKVHGGRPEGPGIGEEDLKTVSFTEDDLKLRTLSPKKYDDLTGLREGDVIGNTKIVKKIGQGGMCSVYLARQSTLDIQVAVKVASSQLVGPENSDASRRFLREAKFVAKIRDPHVVSVMDAGTDEVKSLYYIVMEYMDNGSVGDILRRSGAMKEAEVIRVIIATAKALRVSHQFNIVHRDVKPDNIMLSKDGAVKLGDLGLAKEVRSEATFTVAHEIMGSPAYMSPEQIKDFKNVDIRADIYSLGATMYHMLTGKPPFEGETSVNVLMKALSDEPVPPRKIIPSISEKAEAICQKMMDKDETKRYQTPEELLVVLEEIKL